jgi:SAM-dependent methyltransferase
MNLSQHYVQGIGSSPCETALEIGTGAGLGAIKLSACAKQVWATDITARAVHFTTFNLKLNGISNVHVFQGDMFAPVAGLTFDRIASHPPFEPAVRGSHIFASGGEDGEALLARLVSECPRYLNPGGRVYINIAGTDRRNEPLEARIQKWLGPNAAACDLALFVRMQMPPMDYARGLVIGENKDAALLYGWEALYQQLQAEQVVVGYLVLQRTPNPRAAFRIRRTFSRSTTPAHVESLLEWEHRSRQPGFFDTLGTARPHTRQGWEMLVQHTIVNGSLAPIHHAMISHEPFDTTLNCPDWVPQLAASCDGSRTLTEIQSQLKVEEREFYEAVRTLIAAGFLELDS